MFTMGPEFFNFMKKLEGNGDKLICSTPSEQPLEFEFDVSMMCFEIIELRVTYIQLLYGDFVTEFYLSCVQWVLRP